MSNSHRDSRGSSRDSAFGQSMKKLLVHHEATGESFQVALYDGLDSTSILHSIAARSGIPFQAIYLTVSGDADNTIVPLSSALPDGMELVVHQRLQRAPPSEHFLDTQSVHSMADVVAAAAAATAANDGPGSPQPPLLQGSSSFPDSATLASTTGTGGGTAAASFNSERGGERPETAGGGGGLWSRQPLLARKHDSQDYLEMRPVAQNPVPSSVASGIAPGHSTQTSGLMRRVGRFMQSSQEAREQQVNLVNAMEKFSRLATDLANERTLLAWVRTGLAAIRTIFPFYAMVATDRVGAIGLVTAQVIMAFYVLVLAYTGHNRYSAIKTILAQREPPDHFGRVTVRFASLVLFVSGAVVAFGICTRQWVSSHPHNAPTVASAAP
mmetsp:Transcript_7368/g.16130  ORF Transcript_7368/g.16130 Transcript_7368/m.16130 type:complete len:383 (-) Transcript_7368:47-1195(-)